MRKRRRIYTIIMAALAAALLLCACQPTPDTQAIVNKNNSPLDELVLEKARPNEAWTADDRIVWNETKTVNIDSVASSQCTVAVSIDADTPGYPGKVPVVIVEPEYIDIELLTNAAKYLMKGEIFEGMPSKQDIMAEILDFKQEISAHNIIIGNQGQVDEQLEVLNGMYENATDGNSEAKFEFEVVDGVRGLLLKSYPEDSRIMDFTACASRFYFRNREFNRSYTNLVNAPDENIQANGIKTTYEEAKAIAEEAMKTIFSEPFAMVRSNILDKVNDSEYLWNDGEETSLGQAYVFDYGREYGGFASLFIDFAPVFETDADENRYTEFYPREYISIVVDDKGIVNMQYESFSKAVETINDDVKLMPFADIMERFKNEVFYYNLWGTEQIDIKITRIDFGMVRELIKDNTDQYMMVPAWSFIGDIRSEWTEEHGISIITLNALNGGVITYYPTVN